MAEEKKTAEGTKSLEDVFGPVISSYTSDEAVEDGLLVRTKDPIINLMTRGVFDKCVDAFVLTLDMDDPNSELLPGSPTEAAVMQKLIDRVKAACAAKGRDDFYAVEVSGWSFFVERNETGAFSLLFPDEH